MPERSNEFQRLIFLLKQQLGREATVTESKMLKDLVTGANREVDICIETVVTSEPVMVSVECRDRKRAADVTWVEEMKAKHERLSTNALILISRNGFSARAVELARAYNIRTLKFEETTEDDVARVFGNLDSLWTKVFTLTPTKVVATVASTGDLPAERVAMLPDNTIHDADGTAIAPIRDLVQSWLHSSQVREELAKRGNESHKTFVVGWPQPKGEGGASLYLQKIEPSVLRLVELIEARGTCSFEVSRFPLRHGVLGDVKVSWGKGTFDGKDAVLLASKDEHGIMRISVVPDN
jgi:hypothetical protein